MRKTCKRYPGKRREVNPVVAWIRPEGAIARQHLLHRAISLVDELLEVFIVVEICEREVFIRQQHGGAAVNHIVDNHLALSKAIAKWLDLVCRPKREVVICQRHADSGTVTK